MDPILWIIYIIVFLYSVILHEIAHGWVAFYFGDDTAKISGRLSLNPLVHIDPFGSVLLPILLLLSTGFAFGYAKPVPVNVFRLKGGSVSYRWVAMAGILTNLMLALVAALVIRIATQNFGLDITNTGIIFFGLMFILNIVLAVFNSIPFPGFDGFNFLTTFSWFSRFIKRTPLANPLFMARYGLVVSLLILFLAWPAVSGFIGYILTYLSIKFGIIEQIIGIIQILR